MTRLVGLIGHNIKHSISPAFQQAAFDHLGLDVRYELWDVDKTRLLDLLGKIRQPSHIGANVTIPHKESVVPLLDALDGDARRIGAVNTVVNRGGKLTGYNTDSTGFIAALKEAGRFDCAGKRVVLLGAGGVARAASFALARSNAKSLVITDIAFERAETLVADLRRSLASDKGDGGEMRALPSDVPQFKEALSGCDLLVNCSPVGMKHNPSENQSPLEQVLIPRKALIFDVVYNPIETVLLREAKKVGARTLGGLAMLVYQGAASFELWTGRKAPVEIMFEAARRALQEV